MHASNATVGTVTALSFSAGRSAALTAKCHRSSLQSARALPRMPLGRSEVAACHPRVHRGTT